MAARLRTVFFGSSDFSIPSLQRMAADQEIVAVCSQPDKPAGRGLLITPTPVTVLARDARFTLLTPQRIDAAFIAQIATLQPQLLACASYGKILPATLLELPGMAALNVHPSLLPRYRGATPIQAALRDGCEQTGVTIFWMTAGMDAGDIALQRSTPVASSDSFGTLHDKLAASGAQLLGEAARSLSDGRLGREPQREEDATYTKPLNKGDLQLRFDVPAQVVVNQIRSLSPKPAAWMQFDGKRLKVLDAIAVPSPHGATAAPGELIGADSQGPIFAAAGGAVKFLRVILEGKPPMSGSEFAKAATSRR